MNSVAAALCRDAAVLRSHPYDPDDPFWLAAHADAVHLLVIDAARRSGAADAWPADAIEQARCIDLEAAAIQVVRERELTRVLARLSPAGISCVLIKGAALAYTHYARPHLRPRHDTDLLVRPEDMARLDDALGAAGYVRAAETTGELVASQCRFERTQSRDGLHTLDVHWRVSNVRVFADGIDDRDLTAAMVPVPALGPHAWTISSAHALVLACVHRVAHHWDSDNLLWLMDIHLMASQLSAREADEVVTLASRWAVRAVCARGIGLAAGNFATATAADLIARVRPREGAAIEPSAEFIGGTLRLVDLLRTDLATLSWPARLQLLREHLFPPRAYMRTVYARWPAPMLPLAYLDRTVRGVPKWLRRPRS